MSNKTIATTTANMAIDTAWANKVNAIKNPTIKQAAQEFQMIAGNVTAHQVRAAELLGKVNALGKEAFQAEGYKGLGEMADDLFHVGKSAASQLASAAERFYLDPKLPEALKPLKAMFSPYTLYTMVKIPNETLEAGITNGELTVGMSQDSVKQWVEAHKPKVEEKVKLIPHYSVRVTAVTYGIGKTPATVTETDYTDVPETDLESVPEEFQKIPVKEGKQVPPAMEGWKCRFYPGADGFIVLHYRKPEAPVKPSNKDAEIEALKAKLRALGVEA